MIYLLDDKRARQVDYGWDDSRFASYLNHIVAIHSFSQIADLEKRNEIFHGSNIILFHESFFDNIENAHRDNAVDIRNKLTIFPEKNPNLKIVYFSGSKNSRKRDGNIANIPVSILYQNLQIFLDKINEGNLDLNYLLFGLNPKVEEILVEKLKNANNSIEEEIEDEAPSIRTFIALTAQDSIESIFTNSEYKTFYINDKFDLIVSDNYLDEKVKEWFGAREYDAIFIPLCFGPTLADFNGLRFATHIRCTETLNQTKNIFLYSFADYQEIIGDQYFDILKTKNIELIDYTKAGFYNAVLFPSQPLRKIDLSREIKKLKLEPPKNYEDNHSVANEWAIYRWSNVLDAFDKDIERIVNKVNSHLYFKYLKTIYPQDKASILLEDKLQLNYSGEPKVLYIDDEAEKGWYEIFCKIIEDINEISFEHLDDEFNEKSAEEIVQICAQEVKKQKIDIVLLDFRLHRSDFETINPKDVTGLKVLEAIKEINAGIQVIVFSATNKIWNFQALAKAGADGFIVKESPQQSEEIDLTLNTINALLSELNGAFKRMFLKGFFEKCLDISQNLLNCDTEDETDFHDFVLDLLQQLKIIRSAAMKFDPDDYSTLDITFLNCYNFLEKFKDLFIREVDHRFVIGIEESSLSRYAMVGGALVNQEPFVRNSTYDNPSWFQSIIGVLKDYLDCDLTEAQVRTINSIKDARNNFIHKKKNHFNKKELLGVIEICEIITRRLRE